MEDGKGGFTGARTMNEIGDAARFPIIEVSPDGNVLMAWIDRRIDNPNPRQLYLMKLDSDGKELTKNYSVGQGLCECCKLGVAFANGGKSVIWPTARWTGRRFATMSCANPPTEDGVSPRPWRSAMTAGKFRLAPTRAQASDETVAATFM